MEVRLHAGSQTHPLLNCMNVNITAEIEKKIRSKYKAMLVHFSIPILTGVCVKKDSKTLVSTFRYSYYNSPAS